MQLLVGTGDFRRAVFLRGAAGWGKLVCLGREIANHVLKTGTFSSSSPRVTMPRPAWRQYRFFVEASKMDNISQFHLEIRRKEFA